MRFSNWQTRLLAQDLGVPTGSRKAMEHVFNESHTKNSQTVDNFFKDLKINFLRAGRDTKLTNHFEQSTVVCTDLCKFVDLILQRDHWKTVNPYLLNRNDGVGGFLKICLSIFNMDILVSCSKVGLSKKFKDSGVKKVFLIAAVPDVPEKDQNVKN